MSIRERARRLKEEQKEKKISTEPLIEKEQVISDPIESKQHTSKLQSIEPTISEIFEQELPKWISKPWMYVQPKHEGQLKSWLESWSNLILDYCRIYKLHIVTVSELSNVHPFANKKSKRELSREHLRSIINKMVAEGIAKWLDTNQIRVRVYYRTTDEWADAIYDYMMETGKAAEVITLFELVNMEQEWSNLPREEIQEIFEKFVATNKAIYVTKEKDAIEFII